MALSFERQNKGSNYDLLTVKIEPADYLPGFDKKLKEIAKTIDVKGFRKGLVPIAHIRKLYGQAIYSEFIFELLNKELNEYLQQINSILSPIAVPNPDFKMNVNEPEAYTFTFDIALNPNIALDFKALNVIDYQVEVEESLLDKEINKIKENYATKTILITPAEPTDLVELEMYEMHEIDETDILVENGLTANRTFNLSEFSPNFQNKLRTTNKEENGMEVGINEIFKNIFTEKIDDVLASLKFPETVLDKNFEIYIKSYYRLEKPVIDETILTTLLPNENLKNEDDLKGFIRMRVKEQYQRTANNYIDDQVYHYLVDKTPFDLADDYIEKYLQENDKAYSTKSEDEKQLDKAKFLKEIKWMLIVDKIGNDFDIQVEKEEIVKSYSDKLINYLGNMGGMEQHYTTLMQKFTKDKEQVKKEREEVFFSKLFNAIRSIVQKTQENTTLEELEKKLKEHNH